MRSLGDIGSSCFVQKHIFVVVETNAEILLAYLICGIHCSAQRAVYVYVAVLYVNYVVFVAQPQRQRFVAERIVSVEVNNVLCIGRIENDAEAHTASLIYILTENGRGSVDVFFLGAA